MKFTNNDLNNNRIYSSNLEKKLINLKNSLARYLNYEQKLFIELNNIENSSIPNNFIDVVKTIKSTYETDFNKTLNENSNFLLSTLRSNENNYIKSRRTNYNDHNALYAVKDDLDIYVKLVLKLEIFHFMKNMVFDLLWEFSVIFLIEIRFKMKIIFEYLSSNRKDFSMIFSSENLWALEMFYLISFSYKKKTDEFKYIFLLTFIFNF